MMSSLSSLASDSTISTASAGPATTRSSWVSAISSSVGVRTDSSLTKPTREGHALARGLRGNHGGERHGLAVGGDDGAVGLAGHLSGFKLEGASTPVDLDGMLIEH